MVDDLLPEGFERREGVIVVEEYVGLLRERILVTGLLEVPVGPVTLGDKIAGVPGINLDFVASVRPISELLLELEDFVQVDRHILFFRALELVNHS